MFRFILNKVPFFKEALPGYNSPISEDEEKLLLAIKDDKPFSINSLRMKSIRDFSWTLGRFERTFQSLVFRDAIIVGENFDNFITTQEIICVLRCLNQHLGETICDEIIIEIAGATEISKFDVENLISTLIENNLIDFEGGSINILSKGREIITNYY